MYTYTHTICIQYIYTHLRQDSKTQMAAPISPRSKTVRHQLRPSAWVSAFIWNTKKANADFGQLLMPLQRLNLTILEQLLQRRPCDQAKTCHLLGTLAQATKEKPTSTRGANAPGLKSDYGCLVHTDAGCWKRLTNGLDLIECVQNVGQGGQLTIFAALSNDSTKISRGRLIRKVNSAKRGLTA